MRSFNILLIKKSNPPYTADFGYCLDSGINYHDLWLDNKPAYQYKPPPNCSFDHQDGCSYLDDLFTEDFVNTINNHDVKNPLFAILSTHEAHTPLYSRNECKY